MGGRGGGNGNDKQIRAFCRDGAGVRILERDRFVSTQAKMADHKLVEIGFRLRRGDVLATRDEFKKIPQPETLEMGLAPRVPRIRGEPDPQLALLRGLEHFATAGPNGLRQHEFILGGPTLDLERCAVGMWTQSVPGNERI